MVGDIALGRASVVGKKGAELGFLGAEALDQLRGRIAVARQAQGTQVVEIALATAFGDWSDMISVPQGSATGDQLHAVERQSGRSRASAGTLERGINGDGVCLADLTHTAITSEHLIAKIARVGAQTPLMDAVVRTKCTSSFGKNLEIAPTAERQPIGSASEQMRGASSAFEGARGQHGGFRIERCNGPDK